MTLQSPGAAAPEIAALGPWFHNLHLPGGIETAPDHPLGDFPAFKWRDIATHLPRDLSGWTALDIGCNAGFYSFELARRGAEVVGIDADEHYLRQARWARRRLGAPIAFRRQTVYDLARSDERFDLVLFMGVLYHLRHPLLALDLVAGMAERLVVLQTLTIPPSAAAKRTTPADVAFDERERLAGPGWPKAAFVEHSFAGDPTNWWIPEAAVVDAMARSAGLEIVARPADEVWLCRPHGLTPEAARELDDVLGRRST
jgi:tRNA (mo5U34)-methyltransferase